jgi:hypothetical protein
MNENSNGAAATLPDASSKNQKQWREYCSLLMAEVDKLRSEVHFLREQRKQLLDTFVPERHKSYDIEDEQIFAEMEIQPSIEDLISQHADLPGK